MKTLEEIIAAAEHLKPAQFVQLRRRLDQLEKRLWEAELSAATVDLRHAGIDDRKIDQMILRRRRENRS
jgi:hypothetical protein